MKSNKRVRQVKEKGIITYPNSVFDTEIIPAEKPVQQIIFFQRACGQNMANCDVIKNECYTNCMLPGQLAAPLNFSFNTIWIYTSLHTQELLTRFYQDGCLKFITFDLRTFIQPLSHMIVVPQTMLKNGESFRVEIYWAKPKIFDTNVRIRIELAGQMSVMQ